MEIKLVEIRGRATFVPATAIRLWSIGQVAAVAARNRLRPRAPIDRTHPVHRRRSIRPTQVDEPDHAHSAPGQCRSLNDSYLSNASSGPRWATHRPAGLVKTMRQSAPGAPEGSRERTSAIAAIEMGTRESDIHISCLAFFTG